MIGKIGKMKGFAQIPLMIGLLIMAVAIPAATKLVQTSQDKRSSAVGNGGTCEKTADCDSGLYCLNYKMVRNSCGKLESGHGNGSLGSKCGDELDAICDTGSCNKGDYGSSTTGLCSPNDTYCAYFGPGNNTIVAQGGYKCISDGSTFGNIYMCQGKYQGESDFVKKLDCGGLSNVCENDKNGNCFIDNGCGESNGGTFTTSPTTGLCKKNSSWAIVSVPVLSGDTFTWECNVRGMDVNSKCSAKKETTAAPNTTTGSCKTNGATGTVYECNSGSLVKKENKDGKYVWTCGNDSCSLSIVVGCATTGEGTTSTADDKGPFGCSFGDPNKKVTLTDKYTWTCEKYGIIANCSLVRKSTNIGGNTGDNDTQLPGLNDVCETTGKCINTGAGTAWSAGHICSVNGGTNNGKIVTDKCNGDTNIRCCVPGTPAPTISACDESNFYGCTNGGTDINHTPTETVVKWSCSLNGKTTTGCERPKYKGGAECGGDGSCISDNCVGLTTTVKVGKCAPACDNGEFWGCKDSSATVVSKDSNSNIVTWNCKVGGLTSVQCKRSKYNIGADCGGDGSCISGKCTSGKCVAAPAPATGSTGSRYWYFEYGRCSQTIDTYATAQVCSTAAGTIKSTCYGTEQACIDAQPTPIAIRSCTLTENCACGPGNTCNPGLACASDNKCRPACAYNPPSEWSACVNGQRQKTFTRNYMGSSLSCVGEATKTETEACTIGATPVVTGGSICSQCKANTNANNGAILCKANTSGLDISTWISEFDFANQVTKDSWRSDMDCDGKVTASDLSLIISKFSF